MSDTITHWIISVCPYCHADITNFNFEQHRCAKPVTITDDSQYQQQVAYPGAPGYAPWPPEAQPLPPDDDEPGTIL